MYLNDEMTAYIEENLEELKQLIRELAVIPAPSHHEELRAEFCEKWFRGNGFEDVHTDEALNVIAAYGVPAAGRRFLGTNGATLWLWSCLPKPGAPGP